MAADDRMNLDFILQLLDVLERHGYHYHDDQHTGRAVWVSPRSVDTSP